MSKHLNYDQLRKTYPKFIYKAYSIQKLGTEWEIMFHFSIDGLTDFTPCLYFPVAQFDLSNLCESEKSISVSVTERLIFLMGMVELISYWKSTCSPQVVIEAGKLNETEIAFWKKLYFHGLGEFFYQNNILADEKSFMEICSNEIRDEANFVMTDVSESLRHNNQDKILLPIGGGKDSAVSLELLKEKKSNLYAFAINPSKATIDCMDCANVTEDHRYLVRRKLDPRLLELNRQGFLNGHTPFSALVAFITLFSAWIVDAKYIVLSNENSANEPTVINTTVNHQYSKSLEFEKDFKEYIFNQLGVNINYFSILRPFSELAIAHQFVKSDKYLAVFRSCNVGSKTDTWCGHCSKCLFVAIMLAPFISHETLISIFNKSILDDESLYPTLLELIGLSETKPFECVGTIDEVRLSLSLIDQAYFMKKLKRPNLLDLYVTDLKANDYPQLSASQFDTNDLLRVDPLSFKILLKTRTSDHLIPEEFMSVLDDFLKDSKYIDDYPFYKFNVGEL